MQPEISLKSSMLIVCVAVLILVLVNISSLITTRTAESLKDINLKEQPDSGLPVRLKIPKIAVDAVVEYVGVTPDDTMDIPKGPANVGWFNLGPRPGEMGSAVISGHYGWKDNVAAVFDRLYTIQKGDKLYVEDDTGTITVFVVREVRMYGEHEDATDVFGSKDGKAHLNLITCEGVWNSARQSYSNRLIVFTDKVIE